MKTKKVIYIPLFMSTVFLTMCTNSENDAKKDLGYLETKTEQKVDTLKEKTEITTNKTIQYFVNKLNLAKAEISLEHAKIDFKINHDNQKTNKDLDEIITYLSNVKDSTDKKLNADISQLKTGISDIKQDIQAKNEMVESKLDDFGNNLEAVINNFQDEMQNDNTQVVNDYKRHYAELRAKEFLFKAKIAAEKEDTYSKANQDLDEADQWYVKCKKYGNKNYNTTVEGLRKDIKNAKASLKAKEIKAKNNIDIIISHLGKQSSNQINKYQYIIYHIS